MNGDEITVESLDVSLVVPGDDELITSGVILNAVTSVRYPVLVGREEPLAREDRSSLELIHSLGSVP